MKKLDLHIHTIATASDHYFDFSLDILQKYVEENQLDAIAITNHNTFNREQYEMICHSLSIKVFPGIEVNLENGHLLVITETNDVEDFSARCTLISAEIGENPEKHISEGAFLQIFPEPKKYLLIPHYDKKPSVSLSLIPYLANYITCGEVSSAKKFIPMKKNTEALVPVLFGDIRVSNPITEPQDRQTYIDVEDLTLSALKFALTDREKVSLSTEDGHTLFEVLDNGLRISTGLTVVLGKRSSGKSYTLDRIYEQFDNAKYIRQFTLLSRDEQNEQQKFDAVLRSRGASCAEKYLAPFKAVVDDVCNINLSHDEQDLDDYLKKLLKAASEAEKQDSYAKCSLFNETKFEKENLESLVTLVNAVDMLLRNTEYKNLIEKHVKRTALLTLGIELREQYIVKAQWQKKAEFINEMIDSIQRELRMQSANESIPEIDFYQIMMNKVKVDRFIQIAQAIKKEHDVDQQVVGSYRVVAKTQPYKGASEMKRVSKSVIAFSDAFACYNQPYQFLYKLKEKEELPTADYYKYFVHIRYDVLNQYGTPASGGERSEYNLLQELTDSTKCDILILDEPESSFDNLFLKDDVNKLLKGLSRHIPVIIATHNNTIGASVCPDYVIYAHKEILEDGSIDYRLYSGNLSSSELVDLNNHTIGRTEVLLDCLEAGEAAYAERRKTYEILGN